MKANWISQYRGLAIAILRGENKRSLERRARSAMAAHDEQRQATPNTINVSNILAHRNYEPYVCLAWGQQEAQLTVEESREHALAILECAEAAVGDSLIWRLLEEKLGIDDERIAVVIEDLRTFREDRRPKKG